MDAREKPEDPLGQVPEHSAGTLGEVLYANQRKPLVAEAEWVALVRAVAAQEQSALHALYERAHRPVFTLAVRITRSQESAEEVTVDVFHDVWRRAAGYDPANGTVLGWIMNQARSRAIDRLRFEQRVKRVDGGMEHPFAQGAAPDPRDLVDARQQRDTLKRALDGLTPAERQAVGAAFLADMSHAEVAKRLNEPVGTVKTRIRAALRKLRRAIGPEDPHERKA